MPENGLNYLLLEEIRAQLDVPIDQIRAFCDRTEVRQFLGAVPNPSTRGVMWPDDAVPVLKQLLDMRQAGRLEPKNVLAYLQDLEIGLNGKNGISSVSTEIVGQSRRSADTTGSALVPVAERALDSLAVFEGIVRRIAEAQERTVVGDDAVFDASAAAAFLCCSTRMLRREVPASFRLGAGRAGDRWYKRDLLGLKGGGR